MNYDKATQQEMQSKHQSKLNLKVEYGKTTPDGENEADLKLVEE